MLGRAALALAIIAVLVPHEPDLGFGRPGLPQAANADAVEDACRALTVAQGACTAAVAAAAGHRLGSLDDIQALVLRKIDDVKADIRSNGGAHMQGLVGGERGLAASDAGPLAH
ncbi:MAG: hypothetical protein WDM91_02085 [Rhizomicrobium sp.]